MQDRLGKFQIIRQIGKGAMGEVYLGRDTVLGREVAIKTILSGSAFGEEARARFEREAKVTGTLNHPNIVTVYEFGEADGVHFLVMEYVEGENLEGIIQKSSLGKVELLEVLAQVCDALAFAHEHGVIHRDIKPANVLVNCRGRHIQAKLMDFGVALVDRSNLTQGGIWMGTVNYMAPEYLDTGKAGPSSDLFAVGVMLYEILTAGRKPFFGETTTSVLNAILRNAPAPIAPDEVKGLDPEVLSLVKRALAKEPSDRFGSAEALATAIRALETSTARKAAATGTATRPEVIHEPMAVPRPKVTPSKDPSDRLLVVGKGPRATCLSLRVALRQAEPGNQILVLPGVYREALLIDKAVTLKGDGDPASIVVEHAGGPVVTVQGSQVVLEGLTLVGVTPEAGGHPLMLVSGGQTTLKHCHLTAGVDDGLRVKGGGTSLVCEGCRLEGLGELGLVVEDGATAALDACVIQGFQRAAAAVGSGASLTLKRSTVQAGMGVGVWTRGTGQALLEESDILDRKAGSVEAEGESRIAARKARLIGSRFAGVLALPKAQVSMDDVELSGHGASGIHAVGATLQGRALRIQKNGGFGISLLEGTLATLEASECSGNGAPGVLIHRGATAQLKGCKVFDGLSLGVVCTTGGRGVMEGCEVFGNAQTGAQVEPGGSLLLVRCVLRDGRDTGLLLFEDAEATLEECVVHRNARGGILLTKDASDPIIRGTSGIDDDLFRANAQGNLVKLAPVKRK